MSEVTYSPSRSARPLRMTEALAILFVTLIPIEDFFLESLLASSTRIVGGILAIVYLFESGLNIKWKVFPRSFYWLFLVLGLSIVLWAGRPDYYVLVRLFFWMFTTVAIANLIKKRPRVLRKMIVGFVISSTYLVVQTLLNFLEASVINRATYEGMDQNGLAAILNVAIVLIYYFRVRFVGSENSKNPMLIVLLVTLFLGIVATGSRSGFLTFLAGFYVFNPFSIKLYHNLIYFLLLGLPILFISNAISSNRFIELVDQRMESSSMDQGGGRFPIWSIALQSFLEKPVLGHGYRNFRYEFKNYIDQAGLEHNTKAILSNRDLLGTHNTYLEILTESGLLGFFIFVAFQVRLLARMKYYQWRLTEKRFVYALFAVLLVYGFFIDASNQKLYWMTFAIIGGLTANLMEKKTNAA